MRHLRTFRFIAEVARHGSIRGAAEHLNITPSALTRKIKEFEEELGTPVFERLPQGMLLNAAGELLIRHIQEQNAGFERLKSEIAELSDIRRGHVSIVSSQAFVDHVLPSEIAAYRRRFPNVTFSVLVRDHKLGAAALNSLEADLALLLDTPPAEDLHVLFKTGQPLCALFPAGHPLAGAGAVRLEECFAYPVAMPDYSLAIRHLLDAARSRLQIAAAASVESGSMEFLRNYVARKQAVTFQVLCGIPREDHRIGFRPIDSRDLSPIQVVLTRLRARALSVAAEAFANQVSVRLADAD